LKDPDSQRAVELMYFSLKDRFKGSLDNLPLLDPIDDMEVESEDLKSLLRKKK